jgi:imidazoleglycerol phosphate synthase glutamine amidotransferase subunit HisH
MAVARKSIVLLDTGHIAVCIGAGAGGTQILKDVTTEGTIDTLLQADADAQQPTNAAQPSGAPAVGAEVFIIKSSTQTQAPTGSQVWFVDSYATTTDQGATVLAVLTNAANPLLKCWVPATSIRAFPTH